MAAAMIVEWLYTTVKQMTEWENMSELLLETIHTKITMIWKWSITENKGK